ncbi:dTDP-4-dehydrorhamnose reductase [soil metagenome]
MSGRQRTEPRIVVTGAGGQVGRFLSAQVARRGGRVRALASGQCDITDPPAVERVVEAGDLVVNCAAYTNVDAAEGDPDAAYQVNVVGPQNLAHTCARVGAQLIHLSTDYVFSGSDRAGGTVAQPYEPDDETGPLSVYGRTKLAGELAVHAALPDATIVRTSWVYTGERTGADFVADMRRRAARGESVELVDDQIGSPTYVADLVAALLRIARGDIREPVLHVAGDGAASRFDQARAVYAAVGADPELVRPVSAAKKPRPAARPAYSVLGSGLWTAAGLAQPRPWRDALRTALAAPSMGDR